MAAERSPWDKRMPASLLSWSFFLGQGLHAGKCHPLQGAYSLPRMAFQGCQTLDTDAEGTCPAGAFLGNAYSPRSCPRFPKIAPSAPSQEIWSVLFPMPATPVATTLAASEAWTVAVAPSLVFLLLSPPRML